jgi:hypothetical protein
VTDPVTGPIEASWDAERVGIRLRGVPPEAEVQVRPQNHRPDAAPGNLPAMAGRLARDADSVLFTPRFPFVDGTTYAVRVGGAVVATLTRPRPERPATTAVTDIYPTATEVPQNLLRCYVQFTAPMSGGYAADHLRLVDDDGDTITGALLPADHELWDAAHTRLTVLLDPARIKRGLTSHAEAGPALRLGTSFRLVVDKGFRDAAGTELRGGAERRYRVGQDERRRVDPTAWTLTVPPSATRQPLTLGFDRPLDHALLERCVHVLAPDGAPVEGTLELGPGERSWQLTPTRPWISGQHHLVVDPVLEDVAGNSVTRVFDRDLSRPDDSPVSSEPHTLAFHPR